MSADISDLDKLIRKLRKKLRQIERLEFLGRPLNEEEIAKVVVYSILLYRNSRFILYFF